MSRERRHLRLLAAVATVAALPGLAHAQKRTEGRLAAEIAEAVTRTIPFASATTDVSRAATATLDSVARAMKAYDGFTIRIEVGMPGDSAMKDLASQRAAAIERRIVAQGVSQTRIRVVMLAPSSSCPGAPISCAPATGALRLVPDRIDDTLKGRVSR